MCDIDSVDFGDASNDGCVVADTETDTDTDVVGTGAISSSLVIAIELTRSSAVIAFADCC